MVNITYLLLLTTLKLSTGYTSWQQQGGPVEHVFEAPWMEQLLSAVRRWEYLSIIKDSLDTPPPLSHCLHCVQRATWDKNCPSWPACPVSFYQLPECCCPSRPIPKNHLMSPQHNKRPSSWKWPLGTERLQSPEKVQHLIALVTKSKIIVYPVQLNPHGRWHNLNVHSLVVHWCWGAPAEIHQLPLSSIDLETVPHIKSCTICFLKPTMAESSENFWTLVVCSKESEQEQRL